MCCVYIIYIVNNVNSAALGRSAGRSAVRL